MKRINMVSSDNVNKLEGPPETCSILSLANADQEELKLIEASIQNLRGVFLVRQ